MNGSVTTLEILRDLPPERGWIHPLAIVGRDHSNGVRAEPEEIGGFLDPGVGFGRGVDEQTAAVRASPSFLTSQPACDARAATKHTKFAMLPPLTSSPPQSVGNPISSAIHRTACASISVASGDSRHAPTFGFTAAASRSPSIPIGAGLDVM